MNRNSFLALLSMTIASTGALAAAAAHDEDFAKKAAEGGMAEVEMGRIAANKATDQNIKMFGQKMVNDHSSANEELKAAAQQDGITLPQDASAKQKKATDHLNSLQGAEFDKEYAHMMVKDHEEDVALFKHEASAGKDPAMKAFAQKTLPTLEEHLKMAQQNASATSSRKKM